MQNIFIFGLGFSSKATATRLMQMGWSVTGTTRSEEKRQALSEAGFNALIYDGENSSDDIRDVLANADAVLLSIAPGSAGDPVLRDFSNDLAASAKSGALQWLGYYSTVGVYGNHNGEWINEETECKPVSVRSIQRVAAEEAWASFATEIDSPLAIMRLAGIYGPSRNTYENFKKGRARRIIKPGQVFNRIHVADIALATDCLLQDRQNGIYNICDDEPAPPQDVVEYAANKLGISVPDDIPFAGADLSPMGRSFYAENKRVSNSKLKSINGGKMIYPNYRIALDALFETLETA